MAGITGQRHSNATAAQQESNLLAAGILLDDTEHDERNKADAFAVQISHNYSKCRAICL